MGAALPTSQQTEGCAPLECALEHCRVNEAERARFYRDDQKDATGFGEAGADEIPRLFTLREAPSEASLTPRGGTESEISMTPRSGKPRQRWALRFDYGHEQQSPAPLGTPSSFSASPSQHAGYIHEQPGYQNHEIAAAEHFHRLYTPDYGAANPQAEPFPIPQYDQPQMPPMDTACQESDPPPLPPVDTTQAQVELFHHEHDAAANGVAKLNILFATERGDEERFVSFTQSRLGMSLKNTTPITVAKVVENSHAYALGVREGWRIRQINGKDVTSVPTEVIREFMVQSSPRGSPRQPSATLSIDFSYDGEVHCLVFSQAPLGIEFDSENPFRVNAIHPSAYAYACGVRPGWGILKVAGEDVGYMDWPMCCRRIAEKAEFLPQVGYRG